MLFVGLRMYLIKGTTFVFVNHKQRLTRYLITENNSFRKKKELQFDP